MMRLAIMRTESRGRQWLFVTMTALVVFLTLAVDKTRAGHGDLDDAVSSMAWFTERIEPLWTTHSVWRHFRRLGTAMVDASSLVVDKDILAILKQDFEMRLCECRAMEHESTETENSESMATTVVGPLTIPVQPRFRFTRDDLLGPFHFPGESFVSKLNLEEYRPYDFMDSPAIELDTLATSFTSEAEQPAWIARELEKYQIREDDELSSMTSRAKLLIFSWAQRYYWVNRSGLEIAKIANATFVKIRQGVGEQAKSHWHAVSSHMQRVGISVIGRWLIAGKSHDTVLDSPSPVHQEHAETAQLRRIFGRGVLVDPLKATTEIASIRPPMLVPPAVDLAIAPTRDDPTALMEQGNSWEMVLLMQEPSWGLSDKVDDLVADEAGSEDQDAQSASLTENQGHGVSQR